MNATTLDPCRAGFDGCDEMRAEDTRKHPRTPSVRECRHLPIPHERPERLQGPEVGALCVYQPSREHGPVLVTVTERSYVWGPGDRSYGGGSRRYDWKVIERMSVTDGQLVGTGRTLCVDDKDLAPISATARS